MGKRRRLKIILLSTTSFLLFVFFILPIFTRAWFKRHPLNLPSVMPASQWKFYASDDGGFRVLFPGIPESTNEIANSELAEVSYHCIYAWADRQTEYAVGYSDNPKNIKKLSAQQIFDASEKSVAAKFGKVAAEHDLIYKNCPA